MPTARRRALARPRLESRSDVETLARSIIREVRTDGDAALLRFAERFDRAQLAVAAGHRRRIRRRREAARRDADRRASRPPSTMCGASTPRSSRRRCRMEVMPGVRCERIFRPIPAVGLYVPAGSAPLPSTVIMVAVPAQLAGCPQRVLCTPPAADGRANAAVLVAARLCGVDPGVQGRRRAGHRGHGLWHRQPCPRSTRSSGPAPPDHGRQADRRRRSGRRRLRSAGRSFRSAGDRRWQRRIRRSWRPTCWRRPNTTCARRRCWSRTRRHWPRPWPRSSTASDGTLSRSSILQQSTANCRAHRGAGLATALAVSNDYAPEHLIIQTREPRALLDGVHQRRFGVPRRLVAGIDGRLLLRHQPRAADLRLCTRLQRPVAHRLPEAHDGAGTHRRWLAHTRPRGRDAGQSRRPRCACARRDDPAGQSLAGSS